MECKFQVGDKVVCVDASDVGSIPLQEGGIYTLSFVGVGYVRRACRYGMPGQKKPCVLLAELPVPGVECFEAARFRPVKPMSFWLGEKQNIDVKEKV